MKEIKTTAVPLVTDMTLRDHFAAVALPAQIERFANEPFKSRAFKIARNCYDIADAMLEERAVGRNGNE